MRSRLRIREDSMAKKKKLLIPKKFKLEYLREIDRNLVLHCMQPNDTIEGYAHYSLYRAPTKLLARIVHVLGTLTEHYKRALMVRIKVEKKVEGKTGIDREVAEATETLKVMGNNWNPKEIKNVTQAIDVLNVIHKKLKKK
jgi:hypothetical protein